MDNKTMISFEEALKLIQSGHLNEAEKKLSSIQIDNPLNPDVLHLTGIVLALQKKHQDALILYRKALALTPLNESIHNNLGSSLNNLGQNYEALEEYQIALQINPRSIDALYNSANLFSDLSQHENALDFYTRALEIKGDFIECILNAAKVLRTMKRYDEALAHYDQALTLKQDYAEAWSNKAVTLNELKRYDEALAHYDQALTLKQDYAEAWSNKAVTLNELKRYDEALAHYDQALILKPTIGWLQGNRLHTKMLMCHWDNFEADCLNLSDKICSGQEASTPFTILSALDSLRQHKTISQIFNKTKFPENHSLGPIKKNPKQNKIRVGYFSSDFREHPVAFLAAELFELHDKNKFEIFAFSFGASDESQMRKRLEISFDQFIDISHKSDYEVALLSRQLNIDIAVDLGGYTNNSKIGAFAYRAAPIQVSYLGYLGSLGAKYIDYIIADKVIIPPEFQCHYSEKIIYLPSYQINDSQRKISDTKFTKEELNLPKDSFVFCCFNNNYKITPKTFDGWMRILEATQNSVLFLLSDNHFSQNNLIKEAAARGIDTHRLIFAERMNRPDYLSRYQVADLFLDTYPYNAGTTASDALWAGLPVLTLMGESFASRMAGSLLNAIGMPELITEIQQKYEDLAIELANNPKKLMTIKAKLSKNRLSNLLFNSHLTTRNIETAFIAIHERFNANLIAENVDVFDTNQT
jgi:protein O-GlcNAc transferase